MTRLMDWIDDRTGIRQLFHEALYERIPGGARWRYVWGSTLVVVFFTQLVTGFILWAAYSPSSQTAWESVYYIQYEMWGGWLVRGIHHFMAHAMVVLLILHLLQVVIDGAYRAPREFNFWIGLLLMMTVLGLGLTGYLLPWDQKGYWATSVATNLMSLVPVVGKQLQALLVGGSQYGHHTLTRFFALHAGLLPGLLIVLLVVHLYLFRRHGITPRDSRRPLQYFASVIMLSRRPSYTPRDSRRPLQYFWPDQVLRDSVASLVVMAVVLLLCLRGLWSGGSDGQLPQDYLGAELGPPADPSEQFAAARPEWYFLFLFEMLKYFTPDRLGPVFGKEVFGVVGVPVIVFAILMLMPLVGQWRLGHRFNVAFVLGLVLAAGVLTALAIYSDYYAVWHESAVAEAGTSQQPDTKTRRIEDSRRFLQAAEEAESDARRIKHFIRQRGGIPPQGALALVRQDPEIEGRRLFARHCAACHSYLDEKGNGTPGPPASDEDRPTGASNLYGFASRTWLAGLLDPKRITSDRYFGRTAHRDGDMVQFVQDNLSDLDDDGKRALQHVIAALSARAELVYQRDQDREAREQGILDKGVTDMVDRFVCTDCHRVSHEAGELGMAPDLVGYGSLEWVIGIISNPEHERFYLEINDRMPAYAPDDSDSAGGELSREQIELIAHFLRQDQR